MVEVKWSNIYCLYQESCVFALVRLFV